MSTIVFYLEVATIGFAWMLGGGCFVGNEDISCFDLLWQDNDGGVGDLYHFTFFFFFTN